MEISSIGQTLTANQQTLPIRKQQETNEQISLTGGAKAEATQAASSAHPLESDLNPSQFEPVGASTEADEIKNEVNQPPAIPSGKKQISANQLLGTAINIQT